MKQIVTHIYILLTGFFVFCHPYMAVAQDNRVANNIVISAVLSNNYREYREALEGFEDALKQANLNFQIELIENKGTGNFDLSIIDQIKQTGPDLVLAIGTKAAYNLSEHIKNIPIVYSMVLKPQFSNQLPDSNVTGVTLKIPAFTQFSILRKVIPNLRTIGVLYSADENFDLIREARRDARTLGLDLVALEVENERNVPNTLENLIKVVDIIWMIADNAVNSQESRRFIILESFKNNIPVIGLAENIVHAGAAFAISSDYRKIGIQSGKLAMKIFSRSDSSHFECEFPNDIILYVNERIVNGIGLKIPDSINGQVKVIKR